MKITSVKTGSLSIPLKKPFTTALRSVSCVDDIFVKIITDTGHVGYGEAPPTPVITGDTKGSVLAAIHDFIAPAITGLDILDLDEIMWRLHGCIVHNSSAKAAIDMAIYDLFAQAMSKPLYQVLGGQRKILETDITISAGGTEDMVRDSMEAVNDGYRILKIKVGKGGHSDADRIKAIAGAVDKNTILRIDANQGWTAKEAVYIIQKLEDMGIEMDLVEQPVPAHDLKGMCFVTSRVHTPILADESVFSAVDAIRIIEMGAADYINIKLMKAGGIYNALKICAIAETYNVECMMGCMMESRLAISAAAHLAAAKKIITRSDLDGPSLCAHDPLTGGPVCHCSSITLSDTPGIGITEVPAFAEKQLATYSVSYNK